MHYISKNWERIFYFQYKVAIGQCEGDLYELERQAFEFFGRSEISRDMKKSYKYHLYISKSCIDSRNKEGVAQKLGLPRPF